MKHFLIHYLSKICKFGPCVQYWCMRFEGKHAPAKDFCKSIHNFKNICKSIAWQQQIQLCSGWMVLSHSAILQPEVGAGSELLPCALAVPDCVFTDAGIALYEELYFANHIKVNGLKYIARNVLVLNFEFTFLCLD